MNENHARLCTSPEWAQRLQTEVLPWVVADVDLGDRLLEIGPGPGAATDWLRRRTGRLVAVELDPVAAARLATAYAGTNVEVVAGDATALTFPDDSFDAAASFTMLHHVPTAELQDRLLAEVLRVLRPGGVLVGADSLHSDGLLRFHEGDTYNPVDPADFPDRLRRLGYERVWSTAGGRIGFRAYKRS